jgi:hypothetical protein
MSTTKDDPSVPLPISFGDTGRFQVPFELLEQSQLSNEDPPPTAPPPSPFDDVVGSPALVVTPSRSFGHQSTGKFSLEDLLSSTGDVLLLGDPLDIASTAVIRSTLSSEDGAAPSTTTSICIGRDIERMLQPTTVLAANPAAPPVELSGFERFVFGLLDGKATIDAVSKSAGLSVGDLRIALALLADKEQLVALTTNTATTTTTTTTTPSTPWDVAGGPSGPEGVTPGPLVSRTFGPVTVLRRVEGADVAGLSALEQFVLSKIDGRRSVAQLRGDTGLSESDVTLALELLQRRGIVERPSPPPRVRPAVAPVVVVVVPVIAPTPQAQAAPPKSSSSSSSSPPAPAPVRPGPSRFETLLVEADRKESHGDLDGVVAALQQALKIQPANGTLYNRLGIALVRQHNLPAGLAALTQALALSPQDPTIMSNHARIAALAAQVRGGRLR